METRQVVINNQLISYRESGSDGPPVIFLHGWRSDSSVWTSVFNPLSTHHFSLYALDLPGFGGSPTPPPSFTVGDYANLVADFIIKLNRGPVTVVGHSFGGRVAIKLAASRPELLSRLVLVDAAGLRLPSLSRTVLEKIAKIVKPLFRLPGLSRLRPLIYEILGAEDYVATPSLESVFKNIINEDLSVFLPQIKTPTLLIWGDNDRVTPIEWARDMETAIKNARLVVLRSAGHFSFLDQPHAFSEELLNFLK